MSSVSLLRMNLLQSRNKFMQFARIYKQLDHFYLYYKLKLENYPGLKEFEILMHNVFCAL